VAAQAVVGSTACWAEQLTAMPGLEKENTAEHTANYKSFNLFASYYKSSNLLIRLLLYGKSK